VQTVTFDDCRANALINVAYTPAFDWRWSMVGIFSFFTAEQVFKSAFYRSGACTGRTGYSYHGVFAGHGELS
jgi:hypothetical protein